MTVTSDVRQLKWAAKIILYYLNWVGLNADLFQVFEYEYASYHCSIVSEFDMCDDCDVLQVRGQVLSDGTLSISNIVKADTGWYKCRASNNIGASPEAQAYLNITC